MAEANHMARISDEHRSELERKYGRIKVVTFNGHELVFRKPMSKEARQHAHDMENPQAKIHADDNLAMFTIVAVDGGDEASARKAFGALKEEWPYLVRSQKVGQVIGQLIGVVEDEDLKDSGTSTTASASPQTTSGGA